MQRKNYVKMFENFLLNEKFETANFNTFKRAHPVGSKFVRTWLGGSKYGEKETCEISEYEDGDPTDEKFVKSKNVVFTDSTGKETRINHTVLYNHEDERADMSSSGWVITKWK